VATRPTPRVHTAFEQLDAYEMSAVLMRLLDERPGLRADLERLAVELLGAATADAVTDDLVWALEDVPVDDLAARAGPQPGLGYVHETEAANELVTEALQPLVDDMLRRARLGMEDAAVQLCLGILAALYCCRDAADGSVLAYAGPDTPSELASWVAQEGQKAGIRLSPAAVEQACPDWAPL
jgi:hypothetical protein